MAKVNKEKLSKLFCFGFICVGWGLIFVFLGIIFNNKMFTILAAILLFISIIIIFYEKHKIKQI